MRYHHLLCPALALGLCAGPVLAGPEPPPLQPPTIVSAAFSPDRRLVLAGYSDGGAGREPLLRLWDAETGKLVRTFPGHHIAVPYVAFTPDGKLAVAADTGDYTFRLWDIMTGEEVRRFEAAPGSRPCGALSPDGKSLLASVFDWEHSRPELRLWDLGTGKLLKIFDAGDLDIWKITFAPNGKLALLECQRTRRDPGGFRLLDPANGKIITAPNLARELCSINVWAPLSERAAFIPGGARLLLDQSGPTPERPKEMCQLVLWDTAGDKVVRRFRPRRPGASEQSALTGGYARAVAFAPDAERAATADVDAMLRAWDLAAGKESWSAPVGCYAVAFSKDSKRVLSLADETGRGLCVQVRDARTGRVLHDVTCQPLSQGPAPPPPFVVSAAFSPDRRLVLVGYDDSGGGREPLLRLWDTETGKLVRDFNASRWTALDITFSADGRKVVSTDQGGRTVCVWDTQTGDKLNRWEVDARSVLTGALSPDGKSLLAWLFDPHSRRFELPMYDVSTGMLLKTYGTGGLIVQKITFTPDGKMALLLCRNTTRVLDLYEGKLVPAPNLAKERCLRVVTFASDGKRILLDQSDRGPDKPKARLVLWDMARDRAIRRLPPRSKGRSAEPFKTAGYAQAMAFSPGGERAATADADGVLRVWDLAAGKESWSAAATSYAVAFSADGKKVLTLTTLRKPRMSEVCVRVRDAITGKLLRDVVCRVGP